MEAAINLFWKNAFSLKKKHKLFENLIIISCSGRVNKYITQSDFYAPLISLTIIIINVYKMAAYKSNIPLRQNK